MHHNLDRAMDTEIRGSSRGIISTIDWDDRGVSQPKDLSESSLSNIKSLLQNLPAAKTHPLARYKALETVELICAAVQQGCVPATHSLDPVARANALQLAYEVMHYQPVVEDMLCESSFYSRFFQLHRHELLVTVMAYGLMKDKFNTRPPHDWGQEGTIADEVIKVADALWLHRVKLGATLARMRVRACAQHISQLLPESTQQPFKEVMSEPLYTRVNCFKVTDCQNDLMSRYSSGFSILASAEQLSGHKSAFLLQEDLLVLSPDCRSSLWGHDLVEDGLIIPQDPSSYCCVSGLRTLFKADEKCIDVLVTNCDSGVLPMHIATLLHGRGKVMVCGALPVHIKKMEAKFARASIHNIQLLPILFTRLSPSEELFQNVKLIFCNPPCSLSSVKQPVDFIMQEGDEYAPQLMRNTASSNMSTLITEQRDTLQCALQYDQTEHVVYFVRSTTEPETEAVVERVLMNVSTETGDGEQSPLFEVSSHQPLPPGVPGVSYYCTVFKHVPPKPPPAASEIIARAISEGILSGEGISSDSQLTTKTSKKCKSHGKLRKVFSHYDGIPMTFSAQQKTRKRVCSTTSINKPRPFRT